MLLVYLHLTTQTQPLRGKNGCRFATFLHFGLKHCAHLNWDTSLFVLCLIKVVRINYNIQDCHLGINAVPKLRQNAFVALLKNSQVFSGVLYIDNGMGRLANASAKLEALRLRTNYCAWFWAQFGVQLNNKSFLNPNCRLTNAVDNFKLGKCNFSFGSKIQQFAILQKILLLSNLPLLGRWRLWQGLLPTFFITQKCRFLFLPMNLLLVILRTIHHVNGLNNNQWAHILNKHVVHGYDCSKKIDSIDSLMCHFQDSYTS